MEAGNRGKDPADWTLDIKRSVTEYADWYMREAPMMWVDSRHRAVAEAELAMRALDDFRDVSVQALTAHPAALSVIRMAISPKMARERFIEFIGLNKNLVERMERDGAFPKRGKQIEESLERICEFVIPLLDPELFPWIKGKRAPSSRERADALLVLGDRRTGACYDPIFRNAQEARQKALMGAYLESHGLRASNEPPFEMPPGSFRFGRNMAVTTEKGRNRNMPIDCVVAPASSSLPLACVEMKSAGDFTNVNKRRKEEAEKHNALSRVYGDRVVFLLQIFGYFDSGYLSFEADAGIDWAWDHRLGDLAAYFGI